MNHEAGRHGEGTVGKGGVGAAIAALGVVFGDIGTSPLYAFRMCISAIPGGNVETNTILGVLSLVFWSITVVITIKYLLYILRADLNGEGGVLALMVLSLGGRAPLQVGGLWMALGIAGGALLYGDGMITPAISVLSAIEGVAIATPSLQRAVIPISLVVLIILFAFQRHGTRRIGRFFGPVMLLWFAVLAGLGGYWIFREPMVLQAIDPRLGIWLLSEHGKLGLVILGFVFLVVTGGEALYAALGHFGIKPIRRGWFWIAMPAILLNYFGQGALLIQNPDVVAHTFYSMAPDWLLYPLVGLATAAAVIASQAVISGAFSLTHQAVRLGFMPGLKVKHYAPDGEGQVYFPAINGMLLVASCLLVLLFRSSDDLAGAYGLAVSGTMVITTVLANVAFARTHGWIGPSILSLAFLVFDGTFLVANLSKIEQGGWFPAVVAAGAYMTMNTWMKGRKQESAHLASMEQTPQQFESLISREPPVRTPGTGIFLDSRGGGIPGTLSAYWTYTRSLPAKILFVTVITELIPRVPINRRVQTSLVANDVVRINIHYGFMQTPNVPAVLGQLPDEIITYAPEETTFLISRRTPHVTGAKGMYLWRKKLFAFLARNADEPIRRYQLPADRVLEIGLRYRL